MIHVVTGCAGFIGSKLTDRLLASGGEVIGVDCFRDYYPVDLKQRNLEAASSSEAFELLRLDLSADSLEQLDDRVGGGDLTVYHLAAQAGVRKSWGKSFEVYARDNIIATQKLLEWAGGKKGLVNFVFASSSSVYGDVEDLPMREDITVPRPHSPYGVTKLAAENLVRLYSDNYGLPSVSIRFFTVYGPRQRPDMAFHRFIRAGLAGEPIEIYGNGSQTRDFTFVEDIVDGVLALGESTAGDTFNLGGGNRVALSEAVGMLEEVLGKSIEIRFMPTQKGDVPDTWASTEKARGSAGWKPATSLRKGLAAQVDWMLELLGEQRKDRAPYSSSR